MAKTDDEFQKAMNKDPYGITCYHCEGLNNFVDDLGFFYGTQPRKHGDELVHPEDPQHSSKVYRALCQKCFTELGFTTAER